MKLASMLFLAALLALPAAAQDVESLILEAKTQLWTGMNTGDFDAVQAARATFERAAADADLAAWAHYYAALADANLANVLAGTDEDAAADHLDRAVEHLQAAIEADDEHAEAYALLASVYGRKIGLSPMKGMFLGSKANNAMERAQALAPDNPRVVLIAAISDFNTPGMWGGSKTRGMEGFRRAAALFAAERPMNPLMPAWGHDETYAWIGIAHMQQAEYAEARAAFDQALTVNPGYGWVKYQLLPQLEEMASQ